MTFGRGAALVILSMLVMGYCFVRENKAVGPGDAGKNAPSEKRAESLSISGLRGRIIKDGVVASEVEADDFRVVPRKFFVFQVKSLNEAVVTNAKIKLYHNRQHNNITEDPLASVFQMFTPKGREAGLISRVTARGIEINVYDAGVLTQHLVAAKAEFGSGDNQIIFYKATAGQPHSGKSVKSDVLIWDAHAQQFKTVDTNRMLPWETPAFKKQALQRPDGES